MPRSRKLSDLVTQRPKAVAPKCSKGATKGLKVTKLLSYRRSRCLTYLDLHEQESHGNTLKHHYERGRAINRFPEQRAFEVSMATSARIFVTILTCLTI